MRSHSHSSGLAKRIALVSHGRWSNEISVGIPALSRHYWSPNYISYNLRNANTVNLDCLAWLVFRDKYDANHFIEVSHLIAIGRYCAPQIEGAGV